MDIFFVLSGFLITKILLFEYEKTGTVCFKTFFYRRLVRLAPAFYIVLACFCIYVLYCLNTLDGSKHLVDVVISALYLSNWARALNTHPPDFLGHTWSLAAEQQYYLLWPVVLLTLLKRCSGSHKVVVPILLIALVSWLLRICLGLNGYSISRIFNGLDTRIDGLMIGCATAVFIFYRHKFYRITAWLNCWVNSLSMFSAIGIFLFLIFGKWYTYWMHYYGFVLVELFVAIILIDIYTNPICKFRKYLGKKWLVWLGSISYGLYLWHYPIFRILSSMGAEWHEKFILGLASTIALSTISYYAIERPLLRRR